MTERVQGLLVALDHDIREDDVQALVEAIRCLKHVIGVSTAYADINSYVARERVRQEMIQKMLDLIENKQPDARSGTWLVSAFGMKTADALFPSSGPQKTTEEK